MISGRQPFAAESSAGILSAILTREPSPVSRHAPDAPDELQRIVRKCLVKDRENRYQNVRDLLIDLKNLQQDSQAAVVSTARAASQPRGELFRIAIAAIAVLTLALAILAGYLLTAPGKAIDSLAVLPLVNTNPDQTAEYLSDGITESLINSLSQVPKLRVIARTTVFQYKNQELDLQRFRRELGVRAVLTGRLIQQGDRMIVQADLIDVASGERLWGQRYKRKISDIFGVQEEIARQTLTYWIRTR